MWNILSASRLLTSVWKWHILRNTKAHLSCVLNILSASWHSKLRDALASVSLRNVMLHPKGHICYEWNIFLSVVSYSVSRPLVVLEFEVDAATWVFATLSVCSITSFRMAHRCACTLYFMESCAGVSEICRDACRRFSSVVALLSFDIPSLNFAIGGVICRCVKPIVVDVEDLCYFVCDPQDHVSFYIIEKLLFL